MRIFAPIQNREKHMIREVRQEDAAAIAAINNHYVMHSDASFDTEPTDGETMRWRIVSPSVGSVSNDASLCIT